MNRYDFGWTSKPVEYTEHGIEATLSLTTGALGVVYKHFLVPMAGLDLNSWKKYDHYRHHLSELEEKTGDAVWIKPWMVGGWLHEQESIFQPDYQ